MKKVLLKTQLVIATCLISIITFAQDGGGLDISVDLDGNDSPQIFERPLFWIGVAVFILILALILRGRKK